MSELFNNALKFMMVNEGGLSDHPLDSGGKTIYGITEKLHKENYEKVLNLYDSGDETEAYNAAVEFYKKNFWNEYYESIYEPLAVKLFDFGVNAGTSRAVKTLQAVLVKVFNKNISVDGIFGSVTLKEVKSIKQQEWLYNSFKSFIARYYIGITERKKDQLVFLKGWLNRAMRDPDRA